MSQSDLDEDKPDSDDPKDYADESAIYNWTEEDFENLKPKADTLRSIIKSHGKGNYVEMESSPHLRHRQRRRRLPQPEGQRHARAGRGHPHAL